MRVVFMGTPDFAVGALESIIRAGHDVAAVVTQPDKPKGRGKEMQMTPVKACAVLHEIPVFQPVKVKESDAVEQLRKYGADVFVVAAFGQILSPGNPDNAEVRLCEYPCLSAAQIQRRCADSMGDY